MASIPSNIVAKDSGGNIKKVDLTDLLASYVTAENVQDIVSANLSECLKSVDLSLSEERRSGDPLEIPFLVSGIKLYTAAHDSSAVIYSTQFSVEEKELQKTTDAYRFVIESDASPFGVSTNKKCFLVMSFDGYEHFGETEVYEKTECKRIGAHGGNPILLDWEEVNLGEGKTSSFSYKEASQQIGVFGTFKLIRRTGSSGNIHTYAFRLEFVICGLHAWKNFNEGNKLTLTATTTANAVSTFTANLNSISYPKLTEIGTYGSIEPLSLAKDAPSMLTFKPEQGISIQVENADKENASLDEKIVSIGVNLQSIAGSGLVVDGGGTLSVPSFVPASGTNGAVSGLVPSANADMFDSILTASGWKTFEELGLNSSLRSFIGATISEDGEMGFVPKPYVDDRNKFLKGDGTWSGAISDLDGEFQCTFSPIKRRHSIGISLCGSEGQWLLPAVQCTAFLAPDESEEGNIELNVPIGEIHGVSVCSPWSTEIPVSEGSNTVGWTADKTFWSESKEEVFSVAFSEGYSADVWLTAIPDSENPEIQYAVINYRINGCQIPSTRSFVLSIDGTEQSFSCTLAENQSTDFNLTGDVIKIWSAGAKSRILYDIQENEMNSSENEFEEFMTEVPWGGYNWVDQERRAMLQSGALTFIEDSDHAVSALIEYEVHPEEAPILVYGLNPESDFWDIKLREEIEYHNEVLSEGTTIGHVWRDGDDIKAASQLFSSWSVQPVLYESNDPISISSPDESEEVDSQLYDCWIDFSSSSVALPFLGLEISRTEEGIHVSSFKVDLNEWPDQIDDFRFILNCGFKTEEISAPCLVNWMNERLESHELSISNLDEKLKNALVPFAGATETSSGKSGLVPAAGPEDRGKVLMGDGTWGDGITVPFTGAGNEPGTSGLVPAPQIDDAGKYLRGDGTWAEMVPASPFMAVSNVSLSETEVYNVRTFENTYEDVLEEINALLSEHPSDTIYITLNKEVLTEVPDETCIFVKIASDDDVVGLEIGEISVVEPADEEEESSSSVSSSFYPLTPLLIVNASHLGTSIETEAEVEMDEEESIRLNSLYSWILGNSTRVNGLKVDFKHTVTGENSSTNLNLLYQGATSYSDGISGLILGATIEERGRFFRGDGTWQNIPLPEIYRGATSSSNGEAGLVPAASPAEWKKVLRGDGTWQDLIVVTTTEPVEEDEGEIFFYIEDEG